MYFFASGEGEFYSLTQWTVQYTYLSLFCFLLVPRFEIGNHCLLIKVRCQLKGVCHELFYLFIFMIRTHLVSWLNKITYFRIRFRFCRDIWIFKKLPGVNDTSEYESRNLIVSGWSERDSQVKIFLCENTAIMRKNWIIISMNCLCFWCHSHRGVRIFELYDQI